MLLKKITVPLYRDYEVTSASRQFYILSGYRPECSSFWQCVSSLFKSTNETANFWTSFLPGLYFTYLLMTSYRTDSSHHLPYFGYLLTVTTYHWMSCCAHAFCNISLRARCILFFLDYSAISLYSFGSAVLYISYSFPPRFYSTRYEQMYLPVAAVFSVGSATLACTSRVLAPDWSRKYLLLVTFGLAYAWDHLPIFSRLSSEGLWDDPAVRLYLGHFLTLGLASFLYGTHIPERLAPGKFDYLGNSHNLMHLLISSTTELQRRAGFEDMTLGRGSYQPLQSGETCLVAIIGVALVNISIVVVLIAYLPHRSHNKTTQ